MVGGKIIIITDSEQVIPTLKKEKEQLSAEGNIGYDLLILTTNDLVINKNGTKSFSWKEKMEDEGILVWDGTDDDTRTEYSIDPEEARVLQYESSRGLEGWTVCCLNFDLFIQNKKEEAVNNVQTNPLLLESSDDARNKYVQNWAMIPLTRPIDTLIITLHNPTSEYSKQLLELAGHFSDYVTII